MTWTWDQYAHRGLLALSLAAWVVWAVRRRMGRPTFIPALSSQRVAPWGLADLLLAALVWVAVLSAGQLGLSRWLDVAPGTLLSAMTPTVVTSWLIGNGLALLLATLLAFALAAGRGAGWRAQASPTAAQGTTDRDHAATGQAPTPLWIRRVTTEIGQGLGAFIVLAGPVLGLQELLAHSFPTKHPLVELLRVSPRLDVLGAAAFSAIVVAPLVEELQFRVLIQGWLMRVADAGEPAQHWFHPATVTEHVGPPRIWPVVVSATLFALAHWSHGPDPIPLFLFALGLGELYRRSRRLLPVVVAHLALNAWSMMLLTAEILRT